MVFDGWLVFQSAAFVGKVRQVRKLVAILLPATRRKKEWRGYQVKGKEGGHLQGRQQVDSSNIRKRLNKQTKNACVGCI